MRGGRISGRVLQPLGVQAVQGVPGDVCAVWGVAVNLGAVQVMLLLQRTVSCKIEAGQLQMCAPRLVGVAKVRRVQKLDLRAVVLPHHARQLAVSQCGGAGQCLQVQRREGRQVTVQLHAQAARDGAEGVGIQARPHLLAAASTQGKTSGAHGFQPPGHVLWRADPLAQVGIGQQAGKGRGVSGTGVLNGVNGHGSAASKAIPSGSMLALSRRRTPR